MHVTVGAVALRELSDSGTGESTALIRGRVSLARAMQAARFKSLPGVGCNAHAPGRWIDANGGVDADARALLHRAADTLSMSARGYHRVLKVARTIADIDADDRIRARHVAEALRYRPPARFWPQPKQTAL